MFNKSFVPIFKQNVLVPKFRITKCKSYAFGTSRGDNHENRWHNYHTCLNSPNKCFKIYAPPFLSDKMQSMLMKKLSEVKVIITDETSKASNDLLLHIHLH